MYESDTKKIVFGFLDCPLCKLGAKSMTFEKINFAAIFSAVYFILQSAKRVVYFRALPMSI